MTGRISSIEDLAARLGRGQRLMGVDLGTKTIGLALSDVERRLATPLETLKRGKFSTDAAQLLARARKFDVAAFVIGLPLNMDGSEGPRAQATRAFVRNLSALTHGALRLLGRETFDRRRHPHVDRTGCLTRQTRRSRRSHGRRLYSARRARPTERNGNDCPIDTFRQQQQTK